MDVVSAVVRSLLLLSSSLVLFFDADARLLLGESLVVNQTLVSDGGTFALGFFTPGPGNSTSRRYLGIWYNNIPVRTVVWVANRDNPFTDASVRLHISNDSSSLVVSDSAGSVLWASNGSGGASPAGGVGMAAVLLDSGNLVLRTSEDGIRWQSFDQPGNTGLSGMKLWFNKTTGLSNRYTSWKGPEDPSPGDFSFGIDPVTVLQVMLWRKGQPYWRYNPWNGYLLGGSTLLNNIYASYFSIQRSDQGATITFTASPSPIQRLFLDHTGVIKLLFWDSGAVNWTVLWSNADTRLCEVYAACGAFGFCNKTGATPACSCLEGYEPRAPSEWKRGQHSGGCALRRALTCGEDRFVTLSAMKLPDELVYLEEVMSQRDCEAACRSNCSCTAYAHANATNVNITISRCYAWYGELRDIVQYSGSTPSEDLHLRLPSGGQAAANKQKISIWFVMPAIIGVLLLIILIYLIWMYKSKKGFWRRRRREVSNSKAPIGGGEESADPPLHSFEHIVSATNNFSESNKLGEGGFGKVYKGILCTGEEVAIKRLSEGSRQGQEEFKNEVALIAKVQHKNLVRLLGSCIKGEERILIYEYLPNSSLNTFLFDMTKQTHLDWQKRLNIVKGIARGLMYLHEDSRLKIVHRDLKAGNILLDGDMNPKISDFGMARIFGDDESRAITHRVVGTYGYMSPEYAMEGHYSARSDVYSFGVLLLEIISGRRNSCFYHNGAFLNLLTYAWQMWKEGQVMELLDSSITHTSSPQEVSMCVHVGLLCVQDRVIDRPLMSSVTVMLENKTQIQETPKRPMFMLEGGLEGEIQTKTITCPSINDLSVTTVDGR